MSAQSLILTDPTQIGGTRRLNYSKRGQSLQVPILCMHGLTRNGRDFEALAQALEPQHQVLCPDMAGRGGSDWLTTKLNYHYGTYLTDTMSLLTSQNITQVGWVGTSMGGILGMMAASASPTLVKWLVLNDVGSRIPAAALKRITDYAGSMQRFASREAGEAALRNIGQSFGLRNESEWQQFISATLEPTTDGHWQFACDPDILLPLKQQSADFSLLEDVDLSVFWEAITCPVLLLRGGDSDILPHDIAQAMAQRPNVTLVEFPAVGHAPALLSAEQILSVTRWITAQAL
ncbi:MAG: alpha/beta hydrolase [Rickettsiales bacterium]|nr:alpha/beta hydrolase [Rickettsiales bacterium]